MGEQWEGTIAKCAVRASEENEGGGIGKKEPREKKKTRGGKFAGRGRQANQALTAPAHSSSSSANLAAASANSASSAICCGVFFSVLGLSGALEGMR